MSSTAPTSTLLHRLRDRLALPAGDLLRDHVYRRLWTSILISSFGAQVTLLALPLTAALLLHATPMQMGILTALETLPFVLFSLPAGVWLDRVRKLPVYVAGEFVFGVAVASVTVAWWLGVLTLGWLYVVAFLMGCVHTLAGSAAQVVLTQVVPRSRLVEAHARNALASSTADVAGPGVAGLLIKLLGAPLALAADAVLLLASAAILRGVRVQEGPRHPAGRFMADLKAGLRFVVQQPLLLAMAATVGAWQMSNQAAAGVQILFATRELGLDERAIGLSYVAFGVGTIAGSLSGHRLAARFGPGPMLLAGIAISGLGWLAVSLAPSGAWGVAGFVAMLMLFGAGAVFTFINFLALRQAVTPEPLLGRMTTTMRWLILLPAAPGAVLGGWLGEHYGLRASLAFAGSAALLAALAAWQHGRVRQVRRLPTAEEAAGTTR